MELAHTPSLSASALKWIALISMVLDHTAYFFSLPIELRWLGRLAAPIFLYLVVEGFCHTHNLRRYLLRMYAVAAGMGIANAFLEQYASGLRTDGLTPDNSICSTFFLLLLMLAGIRELQNRRLLTGFLLLLGPVGLSVAVMSLLPGYASHLLLTTLAPSPFYVEGGFQYLGLGILVYLFRENRKTQFAAFLLYSLFNNVFALIGYAPSVRFFFTDGYQWMEIFALIPLAFYHGERGNSPRWFFYFFYPAHIYLLYFISTTLF